MRWKLTLIGVSLLVAVGLVAAGRRSRATPTQGRLVAEATQVVWQSPVVPLGQTLVPAHATFRLANPGGRSVNILSIDSGCGCAKPVPSATAIASGQAITLDVEGKPFPIGDRTVAITVHTDSPETPTLDLKLRMLGSRQPPFLLDATGELAFLNVERSSLNSEGESRKFVVHMVELESEGREPTFRVDPPSLKVTKVSSTTQPYVTPGSVIRTYNYQVSFAEPPIESRITGTVAVVDPWFEEHVTDLKVDAEVRSRIRVTPSRVDVASGGGADGSVEFLVLTNEPVAISADEYRIETEGSWHVEPISAKGGVARFRITAAPSIGSDQTTGKVTIRVASIADESAVVAITARRFQP